MATNNLTVGLKLVKNNTPTATDAPYLGMAIPVGSLAYDNILTAMLDNQTFMSKATAQYFLKALFEYAAETIGESAVRISTGTVSLYPAISGSFDSEDATFDPTRNSLYVGASFSQTLRDEVAGVTPTRSDESTGSTVAIHSVMDLDTETPKVIRGKNNFRMAGINLTVPDGADESLALYTKDLLTKVCDIVTSETDGGQRITCHLPGTKEIAKGTYKIRLASHGLDPTDPLTVTTATVTLSEAVVPTPELTKIQQGNKAAGVAGFGQGEAAIITITGTIPNGKQSGDKLILYLLDTDGSTILAQMDATSYITASDDTTLTLGNGLDNDSAKPDGDWQDHQAKFVFTRGSNNASLTFTFQNA